jgi:hypothetical protein
MKYFDHSHTYPFSISLLGLPHKEEWPGLPLRGSELNERGCGLLVGEDPELVFEGVVGFIVITGVGAGDVMIVKCPS